MKRLVVISAVALLASAAYCASVPAVQKLLPSANAVKGFTIMAGSLVYGKGDDVSKIYDGGYELYTKNGVVDAARQMYQRKDDYAEVTVHTMKTPKAALDFLKYWQKENKAKTLTRSAGTMGFLVTKPNTQTYFVKGKYFVTVSAFYAADKAKADLVSFRTLIAKAIPAK